MRELSRIAGAYVGGGYVTLGEVEIHQLVHVFHDDHVGIEKNNSLFLCIKMGPSIRAV